jgi:hypothetical protein
MLADGRGHHCLSDFSAILLVQTATANN